MLPKKSIDTKTFYIDKGIEKPLYCLDYILNNNIQHCIITEGLIDCLTCYEYGAPAIATLGAISDSQIEQINKSCITVLYLMFDNDAAGERFTSLLKKNISNRIIVEQIKLPKNKKDVNELSKEEFKNLLLNYVKNN